MVHCNPAPPHPPPGEIYNVICMGQPYIDGVPVGYIFWGIMLLLLIVIVYRSDSEEFNDGHA